MSFSIIVSTIGRSADLRVFLDALCVQSWRDFETLVVDQSGGVEVELLCAEYRERLAVTHLPMSVRGLSRARNHGLSRSNGDIVTFADDDCVYPPNLLAEVHQQLSESPHVHGITSRSENAEGTSSVTRFDREPGRLTRANMFNKFIEFGLFLRRDVIPDGPFDEDMGVGAGTPWAADEGLDLVVRLLKESVHIEYRPDLVIIHPAPQTRADRAAIRRQYTYGCGRGRLFRKHHFPHRVVVRSMVRSLGGAVLMLASLRVNHARAYSASFLGKLRGLIAPGQLPR